MKKRSSGSFENLPDVLTIPMVADVLHLSERKVYALVRDGDLHAIHAGRSVRVLQTKLEEFMAKGGTR